MKARRGPARSRVPAVVPGLLSKAGQRRSVAALLAMDRYL